MSTGDLLPEPQQCAKTLQLNIYGKLCTAPSRKRHIT